MSGVARAGRWLLLFLLLLCLVLARGWQQAVPDSGGATLYLPQGVLDYDSLLAAEQRTATPLAFTLWRQQEGIQVEYRELAHSQRVSLVTLYGDSALPLPALPMLLPASVNGCLVDTGTSYRLFGDHSPVGGVLWLEGKPYTIVGIFDWPTPAVVRQGTALDAAACDRITLGLAGVVNKAQEAEDFVLRHGLSPVATLSASQWTVPAGLLAGLLPLTLLLWLLWESLRLVWQRRETPVLAALLLCGTLAAAALFWRLAGLDFPLPVEQLPARWSDFDYWAQWLHQLGAQLWTLLVLPKELPQAMPMLATLRCAAWALGGLLVLPLYLRRRPRSARGMAWEAGASLLLAVLALAVAPQTPTGASTLLFLLPAFWLWKALLQAGCDP